MRDVLVVIGVIAFFSLGAAYIAACARILTSTGDIAEPLEADDERGRGRPVERRRTGPAVTDDVLGSSSPS